MCPTHAYAGVCADKYIWSDLNSNQCPSNSSRITGERDCFLSATAAGMQPSGNLNVAVPDRPKGCYWASYGNVWRVWLNNDAVGARNPFSRLMCAKDDFCDAGTYKPPTSATGCNPCCDCEIGTYQPLSDQSSCNQCPKGTLGLQKKAASEADGCVACPAGTYAGDDTPEAGCSICAPGFASNSSGMGRCDACPGPDAATARAACPGGAAFPYTDAQLAVAQSLLPPKSPKQLLEKQCQTTAPQFVRRAGALLADDNARSLTPSVLRFIPGSDTEVGLIIASLIVAAFILVIHGCIPRQLWAKVDITAMAHKTAEGTSPVKQKTQLGSAFTLALVFLIAALAIALYNKGVAVEESSGLVLAKGGVSSSNLRVSLTLPLGDPLGKSTPYCAGIDYAQNSLAGQGGVEGMSCNASSSMSLGESCELVLTGCTFTGPNARLTFKVPWRERFVNWSVAMDSAYEATEHALSGVVTSGSASDLISPTQGVVVAMLAHHALINDTTDAKLTRAGFLLKHLPCTPPVAVRAEGSDLMGSGLTWNLTIELRESQDWYETVRFRKQDPLPLVMSIIAALLSFKNIWLLIFTWAEGPIFAMRKCCCRARMMRKEGYSGDMLSDMDANGGILAKVLSESSKHAAIEERGTQHEQTIRELTRTVLQLTQTVQQLQAVVSSLQVAEDRAGPTQTVVG
jgi:hypothetical protein